LPVIVTRDNFSIPNRSNTAPGKTNTTASGIVLTRLQVQSDHERKLASISSGITRADIDNDYHGPVII